MTIEPTIKISEIFGPTLQGEGPLIGRQTLFVRTGGCDYRCNWCDTLYAVESIYRVNWQPMTAHQILKEITVLSKNLPSMITLSGGNPAIQPLQGLLDLGHKQGHSFSMETQGSVAQAWFSHLDYLVLSPKPPSSGWTTPAKSIELCLKAANNKPDISIKIVIADDADFNYAKEFHRSFPELKFYLQPCNLQAQNQVCRTQLLDQLKWLVEKTIQQGWRDVIVLPQLHTLIWGNQPGH